MSSLSRTERGAQKDAAALNRRVRKVDAIAKEFELTLAASARAPDHDSGLFFQKLQSFGPRNSRLQAQFLGLGEQSPKLSLPPPDNLNGLFDSNAMPQDELFVVEECLFKNGPKFLKKTGRIPRLPPALCRCVDP